MNTRRVFVHFLLTIDQLINQSINLLKSLRGIEVPSVSEPEARV